MKKTITLLLAALMTLSCCSFAACGGSSNRDANTIEVRYFAGGFGSAWLESAKEKFEAANPGKTVLLKNEEGLRNTAGTYLKSGKNLPDIMMTQTLNWAEFVSRGYLEPLDDVYEMEVNDEGVKLKDFLADDIKEYPYMQRLPRQGTSRPWVIPWSALNVGIVYNDTMLKATPRRSTGGNWTEPPATVEELKEYVDDLKANDPDIIPFAWAAKEGLNWLLFPMYTWWAQLQGVETPNIDGEGTWYDFWDFGMEYKGEGDDRVDIYPDSGADVWKQTGIWQSMDIVRDLLVDTTTNNWKNSPSNVNSLETTDAERLFVESEAAMLFCGSWLENEMRDFLPEGFVMKMMPTPTAAGAQINPETGEPYVINNTNAGDVMFIPAEAPNKELAKEFLKFISTEEMMMEFTRFTGMIRPYKYDPLELDPDYDWSEFAKSCFDLYANSDYNLYEYSKNGSLIYTYKRPELYQEMTIATALNALKSYTGKEIMIDGRGDASSVYDLVKIEYPKWRDELGLDAF